ncbi:MAG: S41 family peptidase [Parafilimonas sp.]|nr:S41 family peptidase [Parafilimonas sp.]
MKKDRVIFCFAILFTLTFYYSKAQSVQDSVSQTEKENVIISISGLLNKNYIFPDVSKKICDILAENLKRGSYSSISDPVLFAEKLTNDLQSISKDVHLAVSFNPQRVQELKAPQKENNELSASRLKEMQLNNFGFKKIELLNGNIGYLELESFADARYGGETAVAAMNFLSNASALIIDLRNNGGGNPSMTQLIASYLFTSKPVHLNTFYNKSADTSSDSWTYPFIPGKRMPNTDVYILTSSNTFSAAEEFAYDMQSLKRATIIGETTGGGAHTGSNMVAGERFIVFIPTGRGINPITKTDWEGVGVKPDITVPAPDALITAQITAIERLESESSDTNNVLFKWALTTLKAKQHPVKIDENILKTYAGKYGHRLISYNNGDLYYQRDDAPKIKMIPLEKNLFELEGIEDFRLNFVIKENKVVAVIGLYKDGESDKSMKD